MTSKISKAVIGNTVISFATWRVKYTEPRAELSSGKSDETTNCEINQTKFQSATHSCTRHKSAERSFHSVSYREEILNHSGLFNKILVFHADN